MENKGFLHTDTVVEAVHRKSLIGEGCATSQRVELVISRCCNYSLRSLDMQCQPEFRDENTPLLLPPLFCHRETTLFWISSHNRIS